jgi:lipoprotein-anchoring transpeptidase ErfK/SrfK
VQALELGRAALKNDQKDLRSVKLPASGSCGTIAATDCRFFTETKHTAKWGFLTYWNDHGGERLIGRPITEEFVSSSGWTVQYFERAVLQWKKDKGVSPRAIGKEIAKARKITTAKVAQPVGVPVYDESLFVEPAKALGVGGENLGFGPGPQQGGSKEIVVSLTQEAMWVYEDGQLVLSTLVSTGVAHSIQSTTPVGDFSILTKYESQTMSGVIDDEAYNVPNVPWVMYFDDLGDALHGTYWHNNFGTPMSHGCVNLPLDVASFLYSWAEIGTLVTVIG